MKRVPCAFSIQREFLALVDARARSLNMTRSQYVVQVLRQDIMSGMPNLNIVGSASAVVVNGNGNRVVHAPESRPQRRGRSKR